MVSQLEELCFPDPYPLYFLQQLAESNPEAFLIAEREERLVGYAVADKWGDHNHLVSIAVHPHHRRIGVGQALLVELENILGSGLLRLELRKSNLDALQFYLTNGFKHVGTRPGYYGDGEEAILMEKIVKRTSTPLPQDDRDS
jgi:ribosomal-protein-alanine N-acetyltransferase